MFSVRLLGFRLFFGIFAAFFCCLKQWCELMSRTKLDVKKARSKEVLRKNRQKKNTIKNDAWIEKKGLNIEKKMMIKLSYCHTRDALVC